MRELKLVGAQTFSSSPRGVTAVRLGDTVKIPNNADAEELLGMSYMDTNGNEVPYFSENLSAPLLFKKKAVTMSMMEAVKKGSGTKAASGVRKARARKPAA